MIVSTTTPSAPPHRTSEPGATPARLPPGPEPADNSSEWDLEATLPVSCPPFEWPAPAGDVEPAKPVPASPPKRAPRPARPGETPWADRRLADRLPVRPGARVEVRRWGGSNGPDIAEELRDVSEAGVGVRLSAPVRRGERFDVTLWGPGAVWCGRGMGIVRWAVIGEHGVVFAGLQLNRKLTAQALRDLT